MRAYQCLYANKNDSTSKSSSCISKSDSKQFESHSSFFSSQSKTKKKIQTNKDEGKSKTKTKTEECYSCMMNADLASCYNCYKSCQYDSCWNDCYITGSSALTSISRDSLSLGYQISNESLHSNINNHDHRNSLSSTEMTDIFGLLGLFMIVVFVFGFWSGRQCNGVCIAKTCGCECCIGLMQSFCGTQFDINDFVSKSGDSSDLSLRRRKYMLNHAQGNNHNNYGTMRWPPPVMTPMSSLGTAAMPTFSAAGGVASGGTSTSTVTSTGGGAGASAAGGGSGSFLHRSSARIAHFSTPRHLDLASNPSYSLNDPNRGELSPFSANNSNNIQTIRNDRGSFDGATIGKTLNFRYEEQRLLQAPRMARISKQMRESSLSKSHSHIIVNDRSSFELNKNTLNEYKRYGTNLTTSMKLTKTGSTSKRVATMSKLNEMDENAKNIDINVDLNRTVSTSIDSNNDNIININNNNNNTNNKSTNNNIVNNNTNKSISSDNICNDKRHLRIIVPKVTKFSEQNVMMNTMMDRLSSDEQSPQASQKKELKKLKNLMKKRQIKTKCKQKQQKYKSLTDKRKKKKKNSDGNITANSLDNNINNENGYCLKRTTKASKSHVSLGIRKNILNNINNNNENNTNNNNNYTNEVKETSNGFGNHPIGMNASLKSLSASNVNFNNAMNDMNSINCSSNNINNINNNSNINNINDENNENEKESNSSGFGSTPSPSGV